MKKKTLAIIISSSVAGAIALSLAIPFSILGIRTVLPQLIHFILISAPVLVISYRLVPHG